jgi:hypothetical protein
MVNIIKSSRNILAEYFDVFDTDYPLENYSHKYERVCRVCGVRLLKKDGKYSWQKRQCKKHAGDYAAILKYNWSYIRNEIIEDNIEKNWIAIILTGMDQGIDVVIRSYGDQNVYCNYSMCEKCGSLTRTPEVHHITPVHTLTKKNLFLIWDKSNLICLCHTCHTKINHHFQRRPKTPAEKHERWIKEKFRNKKIEDFLNIL